MNIKNNKYSPQQIHSRNGNQDKNLLISSYKKYE